MSTKGHLPFIFKREIIEKRREEKIERGKWKRRTGGRGDGNRDKERAPSLATFVLRNDEQGKSVTSCML